MLLRTVRDTVTMATVSSSECGRKTKGLGWGLFLGFSSSTLTISPRHLLTGACYFPFPYSFIPPFLLFQKAVISPKLVGTRSLLISLNFCVFCCQSLTPMASFRALSLSFCCCVPCLESQKSLGIHTPRETHCQ